MELFSPNRSLVVPLDFSACNIMPNPQDSSSGKVIAAKPEQLNLILEPLWQDTHTHILHTKCNKKYGRENLGGIEGG